MLTARDGTWMKAIVLSFLGVLFGLNLKPSQLFGDEIKDFRQSIYKIRVQSQRPNVTFPWRNRSNRSSSGTGFYIGNGNILTNAHVVAQGKFITVQRDGEDQPHLAKVSFIAHDCDLALLRLVKKPKTMKYPSPLTLGGLPKLRSPVSVVGYPLGGEQLSVTQGVVSRISFRQYAHVGAQRHLLVQVDSAINSGNSGGPVIQKKKVVGVAFQAHVNAENTGYVIPTIIIKRFLKDIEDGFYHGHIDIGLKTMDGAMENPTMRQYHGLEPDDGGVKVANVMSHTPAFGQIEKNDIILAIANQKVGIDGKINYQGERINFEMLFDIAQIGDTVTFDIKRNGKKIHVPIRVQTLKNHYSKNKRYVTSFRYYVFAGLVFTSLSSNYIRSWGRKWYHNAALQLRYLHLMANNLPHFKGHRDVIVLSKRLPDAVNAHLDDFEDSVLTQVNGRKITSLDMLKETIEEAKSQFLTFRFLDKSDFFVLPTKRAKENDREIHQRYGVHPSYWFDDQDGATSGLPTEALKEGVAQ